MKYRLWLNSIEYLILGYCGCHFFACTAQRKAFRVPRTTYSLIHTLETKQNNQNKSGAGDGGGGGGRGEMAAGRGLGGGEK